MSNNLYHNNLSYLFFRNAKNGLLGLPGDSDSDDDISLLGSGTTNHSMVRSRSANNSLGTVVAVNAAFRRRKGI